MKKSPIILSILLILMSCKSSAPSESSNSGSTKLNVKSISASMTGVLFDTMLAGNLPQPAGEPIDLPRVNDSLASRSYCQGIVAQGDTITCCPRRGIGYYLIVLDTLKHILSGNFDYGFDTNQLGTLHPAGHWEAKFRCANLPYSLLNDTTLFVDVSPTMSNISAATYITNYNGMEHEDISYVGLRGFDSVARLNILIGLTK